MFKIDVEPEWPKEGARPRIWGTGIAKRGCVFKIDVEPESPHEGGVLKIYDRPESPNEGVCLRISLNRNRQMRGRV